MSVDLSEIVKVVDISGTEDANKYLALGWVLLSCASYNSEDGYPGYSCLLGWKLLSGEPQYPKSTLAYD